jgi:hypothetical protein
MLIINLSGFQTGGDKNIMLKATPMDSGARI